MTPQLWQSLLKKYPEANFLQSPEWSSVNKLVGNKPILISLNRQKRQTWSLFGNSRWTAYRLAKSSTSS